MLVHDESVSSRRIRFAGLGGFGHALPETSPEHSSDFRATKHSEAILGTDTQ